METINNEVGLVNLTYNVLFKTWIQTSTKN